MTLLVSTIEEKQFAVSSEAAHFFINTTVQLERAYFNEDFADSIQILTGMLLGTEQFTETNFDGIHRILVWQAENVLNQFRADFAPEFGEVLSEGQSHQMALCQCLKNLGNAVGSRKYRTYVKALTSKVADLVSSSGAQNVTHLRATVEFAKLKSLTESAEKSLYLLGYEDVKPSIAQAVPGAMILREYERSKPILEFFLRHVTDTGVILTTRIDPAVNRPTETIGDIPTLIAYLAYHFRMRVYLLTMFTPNCMLKAVRPAVERSLVAVEDLAHKLKIAQPGSTSRRKWNDLKQSVQTFMSKGGQKENRPLLFGFFNAISKEFQRELPRIPARQLINFAEDLSVLISKACHGQMLRGSDCERYVKRGEQLAGEAFTDEFMAVNSDVLALVRTAKKRELKSDEVEQTYQLSLWQADHFLSHLVADGYLDGAGESTSDLVSRLLMKCTEIEGTVACFEAEDNLENNDDGEEKKDKEKMDSEPEGDVKDEEVEGDGNVVETVNTSSGVGEEKQRVSKDGDQFEIGIKETPESVQPLVDKAKEQLSVVEAELRQLEDVMGEEMAEVVKNAIREAIDAKTKEKCDIASEITKARCRLRAMEERFGRNSSCCRVLKDLSVDELADLLMATFVYSKSHDSGRRDVRMVELVRTVFGFKDFIEKRSGLRCESL
eukprot:m.115795 g.115795  ORF g.115795 m.115795 type:complete len:665 (+) comp37564_c0_seq1:1754-3748(+)